MKKQKPAKEPVRLREKTLSDGVRSLYLDIYLNGRRSYEFLKLYLQPDSDRKAREANKEILALANAIKAQRLLQIMSGKYGIENAEPSEIRLSAFIDEIIKETKAKGSGSQLRALKNYLAGFSRHDPRICDIDRRFCSDFLRHLAECKSGRTEEKLSANSLACYYGRFITILNKAVAANLIPSNPAQGVTRPQSQETERPYLTMEELGLLFKTDQSPVARRAFLFSCLTGLRFSDIQRLSWGSIHDEPKGARIIFKQKKTNGQMYLDINEQARAIMGERGSAQEPVFAGLSYWDCNAKKFAGWAEEAGIAKKFSFHAGRHTYAVMLIELGADIYSVKELLGHRNIATTQIYAKMLDRKKRAIISEIPNFGGGEIQVD